jgi:hypothetical protein
VHELGVEDRRAGRAHHRMVSLGDELGVHHRALANPADRNRHAAAEIGIEPRLRPVGLFRHDDRRLRRARQPQFLWPARELPQGVNDCRNRRLVLESHRRGHRVAIENGHAIGVRTDRGGIRTAAAVAAENLQRFGLHLLFFAADERHHVAENVERRHSRIPRTRHGLHRRDHDRADVELAQRRERHGEHDGRAIWIGDDRASPVFLLALLVEQRQLIGIHFGNQQRHHRIHAEVARVADHDVAGAGKGALDLAGHRGVEAGEHDLRSAAGDAGVDDAVGGAARDGSGQPPRRHRLVCLAFGALAGGEPR